MNTTKTTNVTTTTNYYYNTDYNTAAATTASATVTEMLLHLCLLQVVRLIKARLSLSYNHGFKSTDC